jgi:hypothetical protein
MPTPVEDPVAIRSAVRRNAIWAAGAGAIMLYYGIGTSIPSDAFPPQKQGWMLFLYTLQIGGSAMALSAVLSLIGVSFALLYDAVISVFIGVALALSGVLIYHDNSHQAIFNILFGVIFIHSGYRNWREFSFVASVDLWETDEAEEEGDALPATVPDPTASAGPSSGAAAANLAAETPDRQG